jgi:hypothetical protein
MDSNFSETYNYSEKNDDTNDMISALTEDIPMHKRWQQNSRLHLVTDHQRLRDYNQTKEPMHSFPLDSPQNEPPPDNKRIATPQLVKAPAYPESGHDLVYKSHPTEVYSPGTAAMPTTNQSMHQALDNAMHQLSSQFIQETYNGPQEVVITNLKPNKSTGIGKLKSAFTRKKTPKSVTFGIAPDDPQTGNITPKSPGRRFGFWSEKKASEC